MIQISALQMQTMGRASFAERLKAAWREHHHDAYLATPSRDLDTWIVAQTARAARYGLRDEQSAGLFVHAAWLLGDDFDVRIPVMSQLLEDETLSPAAIAGAIGDFLIIVFDTLDSDRTRHVGV